MGPFSSVLTSVRQSKPLILHSTNAVTINDCANITICFGASPVMSDDVDDAAELMHKSQALLLNIGTITERQMEVMWAAARMAADEKKPIVLDPVGCGSSKMRKSVAKKLIDGFDIAVIKGNASEINHLAGASSAARGVDATDDINVRKMMEFAEFTGSVIVASGATDLVTDGRRILGISNGVPEMGRVSGTGCMAGSCIAAASAVAAPFDAAVSALAVLGIAGERAVAKSAGPGTFRSAFFDEVAAMSPETIEKCIRVAEVEQ